ncbi:MAG: transposase, partial [Nitrososphaeraceae archaeon]
RSSGVERFFGWLKSFRRIQTRYERLASTTYLGFIQLGCIIMILMRLFRRVQYSIVIFRRKRASPW